MSKKLTTEEFIQRAKEIHGDLYDYSKTEYVNSSKKVLIVCTQHGEFLQFSRSHLRGCGCKKCGDEKRSELTRLTTDEFVVKAKKVHGEKYNYSKVDYKSSKINVVITCNEHGDFLQLPCKHIQGHGCSRCGFIKNGNLKKEHGKNDFVQRAIKIHGDRYDYSEFVYVDSNKKSTVKCPIHGNFLITPSNHLNKKGCPCCGGTKKLTPEEVFLDFKKVHGETYDYSSFVYKNNHTVSFIVCKTHGAFQQNASNHKKGVGCPCCGGTKKLTTEDVILDFKKVHGEKYDYCNVDYKNAKTKIIINCRIHGPFSQTPNNHKKGAGCPKCSEDFSISKPETEWLNSIELNENIKIVRQFEVF